MLERPTLWISHATAGWPSAKGRIRRVLDGHGRDLLGHIAVHPGRWLPWPEGRGIIAYEEPDASLVFTAREVGWLSPMIIVTDADGTAVANVQGQAVSSPTRNFVARRDVSVDRRAGRFQGPNRSLLARWEPASGGTLVRFTDQAIGEPFLKMGLLSAIVMDR